ncbi:MAG: HAD-IA family hydrolase [Dehalococcoidia bacterium]|nr:HAD-IA family hydrolase [Dehalococcoidia bacterium]
MDGVLADSEPVYHEAMNVVLAGLGKEVTPELQRSMMGHGVEDSWAIIQRDLNLEGPLGGLIGRYDRELCRLLAEVKSPLPGVRELIDELRARGVPIGLASSSWPGWIEALLGGIGLSGCFDAVVSATMVERSKPAPDIYLLAAERLGVPPGQCIAIEDTPTGMASAKGAGMLTVQVRSASTAFGPLAEADIVLGSLLEFDLGLLG